MFAGVKQRSKSRNKKCVFYGCPKVKRNGHKDEVQIFKCWQCGRQFLGGERVSGEEL
jgi:ribosomal protein L37AE/L43A